MKKLKKIGISFALATIILGFSVMLAAAQNDRREDRREDRNMQSMHHQNYGRRIRRNRNWKHEDRKYWQNNWKWRKHRRHNHHINLIRREEQ